MNLVPLSITFLLVHVLATVAFATEVRLAVPLDSVQSPFVNAITSSKPLLELGTKIKTAPYKDDNEILDAVLTGSAEIGLVSFDAFAKHKFENQPVLSSIFTYPFLLESTQDVLDIQNSPLGDAVLADISRTRLVPLQFWNRGAENLISKIQISSPNDLTSLKIGTAEKTLGSTMLAKLGASQVQLHQNDFYKSLTQGKVNAIVANEVSTESTWGAGITYFTPFRPLVGILFAGPDYWRNLSEKEKRAWHYTTGIAAKFAIADIDRQTKVARSLATYKTIEFPAGNKTNLLQALFSNDPAIIEQVNVVKKTLEKARMRRGKKKTEINKPILYPKPSPIVFVTDRNDEGGDDLFLRFGSKRNDDWSPTCGQIKFNLDLNRRYGEHYSGDIKLLNAITIRGNDKCAKLALSQTDNPSHRILIYVHGYHNNFEDSLRRTAGMAYDYYFDGRIISWAWPSDGWAASYPFDEDSSKWTTPHFIDFIKALHRNDPKIRLNVFTHSMGARILLSSLRDLRESGISIETIIFAAPDEARDIFAQTLLAAGSIASIQTLYGSENDTALYASRYVHSPHGRRIPRAGDGGDQILIITGLESIDTSDIPGGPFGHSYVFESPEAVADLKILITERRSAERRGLIERFQQQKKYWAIQP